MLQSRLRRQTTNTTDLTMKREPTHVLQAEFAASAATPGQLPPPVGLEIAFAGRSNVGKSSLLNCLLSRKNLVRVSSLPGCTRQINFFRVRTADESLSFVDLPGYGYAKRSKGERIAWANLIHGYLRERASLRAAVLLVDARRGILVDDRELIELVTQPSAAQRPPPEVVLVATKLDKLKLSERKPALQSLRAAAGAPVIGFSATLGIGRSELWLKLRKVAGFEDL